MSTIKAAFEGKRELFQRLYLYDNWEWDKAYPVIHISFGSGVMRSVKELQTTFEEILYDYAKLYNLQYAKKKLKGQIC